MFKKLFLLTVLIPFASFGQLNFENDKNIVYHDALGGRFYIFKNIKKNSFLVTDYDETEILIRGLKYFGNLNGSIFQALDKNYNIIYFDKELEKIERPKQISYLVCGSGSFYHIEIIEQTDFYLVRKYTRQSFLDGTNKEKMLFTFTFPKKDFDKIYLINGEKQLEYPDYNNYPMLVIYEKGSTYGVISSAKTEYYDAISIDGKYLKVKKNNLWNYYNFSHIVKYKILEDYVDGLAYFELPNGKTGYLDKDGNEYSK